MLNRTKAADNARVIIEDLHIERSHPIGSERGHPRMVGTAAAAQAVLRSAITVFFKCSDHW